MTNFDPDKKTCKKRPINDAKKNMLDRFPIFFSIKTLQCVIYANFNLIQFFNLGTLIK